MNQRLMALSLPMLALLALPSCSAADEPSSQLEDAPQSFLVLPGADATAISPPNAIGERSMSYRLRAAFPASDKTRAIRQHLKALGFSSRSENVLNPGIAIPQGDEWESFGDATSSPQACVRRWWREWEDEGGIVVTYVLRYRWPEKDVRRCGVQPTNTDLLVAAIFSPPEAVEWHRELASQ